MGSADPSRYLIDSCVLIDVLGGGAWSGWSNAALAACDGPTLVTPVIVAEVSAAYPSIESLLQALPPDVFPRLPISDEAAFLAGQAHWRYRQDGGKRERTLPDFLIGAHAAVESLKLVTRDARRFRRHFPRVELVEPGTHYGELAP